MEQKVLRSSGTAKGLVSKSTGLCFLVCPCRDVFGVVSPKWDYTLWKYEQSAKQLVFFQNQSKSTPSLFTYLYLIYLYT